MTQIQIGRDVRAENLQRSEALQARLNGLGLQVIGLLGSPGSGKTTLLENLLPALVKERRVAVIEGDVATENDAKRVRELGVTAVQIVTEGACHLDTGMVEKALGQLDLSAFDLLLIENVGNLVCPVSFPVGENKRVAVISAVEGEDKPLKYPSAILRTDALVITKTDMAALARVNPEQMAAYARQINPDIRVFFSGFAADGAWASRALDGEPELTSYLLG